MKTFLISLCLIVVCMAASYRTSVTTSFSSSRYTLVEKDSMGVVVEYKEKYGFFFVDTGTILMEDSRMYVLIKRDKSKKVLMKENLNSINWRKLK